MTAAEVSVRLEVVREFLVSLTSSIAGFGFALLLSGCGSESEDGLGAEIDHSDLAPVSVTGSVLSDAPAIGRPLRLKATGEYVWVLDGAGDPGLHVLDAVTGDLLYSIGRKGEAPGEFARAPSSLEVLQSDSGAVWTWDMGLQRMTRFEPRPLSEYDLGMFQLEGQPVRRVTWPRRDRLIGISMSQDARFSLFTANGEFRRSRSGPILGNEDVPIRARLNATDGPSKPCTWPGRGFVILNFFVGRLEYYDLNARFLRLAEVPYSSDVMFERLEAGEVRHLTPRAWYYDCTVRGDTLFALFSGRLRSAFGPDPWASGRYVHMFDWTGRLLTVLRLDRPVRAIAVGENSQVLYASSILDSKIYRYDIAHLVP